MNCQDTQKLVTTYINKELQGKELEEFMEHIKTCKECYEELEIYFTIQFALRQLDNNEQITFDVHEHLAEYLHQTERRIYMKRQRNILSLAIVFLAQMAVILILISQFQIWSAESLESTAIYQISTGIFGGNNSDAIIESIDRNEIIVDLEKKPSDNTSTIDNNLQETPAMLNGESEENERQSQTR